MPEPGTDDSDRLRRYRDKRDFSRTAEPSGDGPPGDEPSGDEEPGREPAAGRRPREGVPPGEEAAPEQPRAGGRFVVQRHRARRLHYDLRLEVDGVLASWAVPKGPTLDPAARRLAVHVEDHPMAYESFEGVIPRGEYGAGDVVVWDRGTWSPVRTDDPAAAIAAGELHFELDGEKLAGRFLLVRRGRGGRGGGTGDEGRQWLLLHKDDEAAVAGWDPEDHPRSVLSGRTNEEVAAAPAARWHSDRPPGEAEERLVPELPRWEGPTEDELAALDALGATGTWEVGGRRLALTNLDKVLFPPRGDEPPITKRDLVRYHARIAPTMLPHLAGRPLNTQRFPDGVDKAGFWHKEVPSHAPEWLSRWRNPDAGEGETTWYIVADSVAALPWLANYGAVELHPWTSRVPDVDRPTYVLFDIDPGRRTSFDDVLVLARLHRTALDHLGVLGLPKVTGQRGIQIFVPIAPDHGFDETRAWAEAVSKAIGRTVPEMVSWAWARSERGGLARLDYTQNVKNKTLVAPYSARPAPGAPVSVPIEWDELDDPDLRPDRWTVRTVLDRVAEVGDPFARLLGIPQRLPDL